MHLYKGWWFITRFKKILLLFKYAQIRSVYYHFMRCGVTDYIQVGGMYCKCTTTLPFCYLNNQHWSHWWESKCVSTSTDNSDQSTWPKNNEWNSTGRSNRSCARTFERWNYPWLCECGAGFENRMTFISLESNSEWRTSQLLGESSGRKSLKIPEKPPFLCSLVLFLKQQFVAIESKHTLTHTQHCSLDACVNAALICAQLLVTLLCFILILPHLRLRALCLNDNQPALH